MGSAVLFHLAGRGLRAVGIEQHEIGHDLGSSSSPSRGFRKASFAHPIYVQLATRAQSLWRELETASSESLLRFTSGIFAAPPDHPAILGMIDCARRHDLPHEILDARQLKDRFPVFRPPPDYVAIIEHEAGVLLADKCNAAHVRGALQRGATIRPCERVTSIEPAKSFVVVRTGVAEYRAQRVVVTAGPWLPALLAEGAGALSGFHAPLRVERQVELWFSPDDRAAFDADRLPLFHFGLRDHRRSYYGIPQIDGGGVKVCRHYGGATVQADTVDRVVSKADEEDVRGFLREYIPGADGRLLHAKVCMNTNTPDLHFVIAAHSDDQRIIVAGGFSGHGFKYAPVIGEIAADLASGAKPAHAIDLFSPLRFLQ